MLRFPTQRTIIYIQPTFWELKLLYRNKSQYKLNTDCYNLSLQPSGVHLSYFQIKCLYFSMSISFKGY